jgi:hypothetical protein
MLTLWSANDSRTIKTKLVEENLFVVTSWQEFESGEEKASGCMDQSRAKG